MASLNPLNETLGVERAKHLLMRSTFGATKKDIDEFAALTPSQALDVLLAVKDEPLPPLDPKTANEWANPKPTELNSSNHELLTYTNGWMIDNMRNDGMSLKERMLWFLHTFIPVAEAVVDNPVYIYMQNRLYRYYALGNFKTLFTKITYDNGMLRYIDNYLNDYASPNENYAREMLELYSIGKGEQIADDDYTNYTENDVKEAARVISGFSLDKEMTNIDPDTGILRGKLFLNDKGGAYKHDPDTKTFSEAFQHTEIAPKELIEGYATEEATFDEIDQLMDMIFAQEATAKFICSKIYRFFVYYDITEEVQNDIIAPLANTLRDNDYELAPVMRQLMESEHFYDADNLLTTDDVKGALIKSPIEITLGAYRFFNIEFPDKNVADTKNLETIYQTIYPNIVRNLKLQGIKFYDPYDVAGYDPYYQFPGYNRLWISPNNLANRYDFANKLIAGIEDDDGAFHAKLDIVAYIEDTANISDPASAETIVNGLAGYMLSAPLQSERFDYYLNDVLLDQLSAENWQTEWEQYKSTNDDTAVRTQLERLVIAIMQSPEYQLM